jgi:hypothetical protein
MRQPSKLRYVECELPDDVERAVAAFEDDFDDRIKPFYERLADLAANDLPGVLAELDAQIALREELLRGSPVKSLASLEAIDKSTGLTSPKRDDADPETVRIDERKLGAAGICLLNGRMFEMVKGGRRLDAIRHLWESAGGDYEYFLRLGAAASSAPGSSCTLFEFNSYTPEHLAFVNKGFAYLEATGYKNSQFRHRLVWTDGISASYSLKTKLDSLGYSSVQINNVFSGLEPNADYDYPGTISAINTLVRAVTRLVFLSPSDPVRQPPWQNEADYIELAIKRFLDYRTKKYTTSAILDKSYWSSFLTELRPMDIRELLENRPEITDIVLPQDMDAISLLVEKAAAMPSETTIINTYMNNLPADGKDEASLASALYDLGLAIHGQLSAIGMSERAARLELVLLELMGWTSLGDYINPPVLIDPADLAELFPNASLPPPGELAAAVQAVGGRVAASALSANSAVRHFNTSESITIAKIGLQRESGSPTNNVPPGATQGLSGVETFSMLLIRRVRWDANFIDCSGEQALGRTTAVSDRRMTTVSEFSDTMSVPDDDAWRQYSDDLSYVSSRLGEDTGSGLSPGASISDIVNAVTDYILSFVEAGTVDVQVVADYTERTSTSDIKRVAAVSAEVLRSIPAKEAAKAQTPQLYSETGYDRGAQMYSAQNRNLVEEQGGRIPQAGGPAVDSDVMASVDVLGAPAAFFAGASASVSADIQICPTKALKALDDYLKRLVTPPAWLVRLLNVVKHQIIMFQDRIDKFILALQASMDAVMAKLERLLTIDLNLSGKIGYENSLFKCSWGLDLGLKINLLDLLLLYLDRFLGVVLGPVLKLLGLLGDFINEIFCIPIRWLGALLNGAAYAAAALLEKIGCTVADFKLPAEVFDILNLINGTFSLRSLVFKKGSADWLKMMGRLKKGANEFAGLTQFAGVCANPSLSASISALQAASKMAVSDIPVGGSNLMSTLI